MENKIISVEWRSANGTVGFVLIENSIGQQSVRVGGVQPGSFNSALDARHIADHGAKLSFDEAVGFFPDLDPKKYKEYSGLSRMEKLERAYGGCRKCYGKGYSTYRYGVKTSADMVGDKEYIDPIETHMNYCICDRGVQLQQLVEKKTKKLCNACGHLLKKEGAQGHDGSCKCRCHNLAYKK